MSRDIGRLQNMLLLVAELQRVRSITITTTKMSNSTLTGNERENSNERRLSDESDILMAVKLVSQREDMNTFMRRILSF